MSDDLEEMFAEASAEENPPVDETDSDNIETDEVEVPEDVEVADDDIEPAAEQDSDTDPEDDSGSPEPETDAELETIIVDGEAVQVTKQELRDGYLRRQDYSRKTAEAAQMKREAEWAKQIQQAFENDPQGTLKALQDAYGVQPEQAPQQGDPYEDYDPDVAAVLKRMDQQQAAHEAELQAIKRQTQEFERRQIVEEVKGELQGLKAEYGDALDEAELLQTAATYNLPLPMAANVLMGKQAVAARKASEAATAKAEAAAKANRKASEAKKAQGKKVATSGLDGSASGTPAEISADDFNTLEELFGLMAE